MKDCPFMKEACKKESCQLWIDRIGLSTEGKCSFVAIANELIKANEIASKS